MTTPDVPATSTDTQSKHTPAVSSTGTSGPVVGAPEFGYYRDGYPHLTPCLVILPYTRIRPGVREALDATGWPYEPVDVSASDESYWELIADVWAEGETFIVVEHDIIVRPDTLRSLLGCVEEWCTFPYAMCTGPELTGLGCTKFDASIMATVPNLITRTAQMEDALHPPKHWCRIDQNTQHELMRRHYVVCRHLPAVEHLRDDGDPANTPTYTRPNHGCLG
jgi:hypothetical protein